MGIASIRFATHTRTWLLIAALTALLIGIGALIGGAFLYLFAGLAAAMNVIGYWFSDRFALRGGRAEPVEPGAMPELEAMVQDLARRAQVPASRLYTIPSQQPNAFATGRNPQRVAVAVAQGLVQHLPPGQVKSVLAHEFGHIKNRDILVSSIAAMVAGAIAASANIFQFSLLFGGDDEDTGPLGWIGLLATIIVAPVAASLLQLAVSRQAQFLGRAAPLADAFETLEQREYLADATGRGSQALPIRVNPATASLYAVSPLARQGVATLFTTHPPIAERVRRLRALDDDGTLRLVA
jgi:heat shock protein HtpX